MKRITEEQIIEEVNSIDKVVDLVVQRQQSLKSMMARYVFEKKEKVKNELSKKRS